MALTLTPTFSPTGWLTFATPPVPPADPTGTNLPYASKANTFALPAGTSPATVLVTNLGPEPTFVSILAAAATTTGTAAAGATVITVASGTSIVVGQAAIAVGLSEGTTVTAVSGTAVTINRPTTAALASTAINFVVTVTSNTGIAVVPYQPLALAYVTSGFISAICANGSSRAVLNVSVGV